MGKYTVSGKCSGDVDDEEYRGLKSRGFTLELELKKDGTGIETRTGPDAGIENFTWSQLGQTLCIKNACVPYELAANEQTFRINLKEDAYCIDEDYNILGTTIKELVNQLAHQTNGFLRYALLKDIEKNSRSDV